MAGITLAQAEEKLALWLAADDAVARGQSFTINGRILNRTNARTIQERIDYWNGMVGRLSSGNKGVRVRYGITE